MHAPKQLLILILFSMLLGCTPGDSVPSSIKNTDTHLQHPYLFHLVQADLWQTAVDSGAAYFPPTYQQDGFTHATANPELLMNVANHFYLDVPGKWLCLQMTTDSLAAAGTEVVFEGTAPVGDKQANFEGTDNELFPHILGGIHPNAVLKVHEVIRSSNGTFLSVQNVTQGE